MRPAIAVALVALSFPVAAWADGERTPAPAGAKVFIIEPADGATVSSSVTVKFGAENVEIAPAGTDNPNSGHHHLLIDAEASDVNSAVRSQARTKMLRVVEAGQADVDVSDSLDETMGANTTAVTIDA